MRSRARGGRAERDGEEEQADHRPGEPQHPVLDPQDARVRSPTRPQAQDGGVGEHGDPDQEVDHDRERVQLRVDDDRSYHGLAHHPCGQADRQPCQIPSPGRTAKGGDQGDHGQAGDRDNEHAIGELDQRVKGQWGSEPAAGARGPIRAPESGIGEPDGGPRDDVERDHNQVDLGDTQERPGADEVL